jgi:hypothetical protein
MSRRRVPFRSGPGGGEVSYPYNRYFIHSIRVCENVMTNSISCYVGSRRLGGYCVVIRYGVPARGMGRERDHENALLHDHQRHFITAVAEVTSTKQQKKNA